MSHHNHGPSRSLPRRVGYYLHPKAEQFGERAFHHGLKPVILIAAILTIWPLVWLAKLILLIGKAEETITRWWRSK